MFGVPPDSGGLNVACSFSGRAEHPESAVPLQNLVSISEIVSSASFMRKEGVQRTVEGQELWGSTRSAPGPATARNRT